MTNFGSCEGFRFTYEASVLVKGAGDKYLLIDFGISYKARDRAKSEYCVKTSHFWQFFLAIAEKFPF